MGIVIPGAPDEGSITVQTRAGTDIENSQSRFVPLPARRQIDELKKQFGTAPAVVFRTKECSGVYNCHGMSFASRRTQIESAEAVQTILREDGYEEVARSDAQPGDVAIYWSSNGDVGHSGMVVSAPGSLGVPTIVGKWGSGPEVVHPENRCPYMEDTRVVRYYRVWR